MVPPPATHGQANNTRDRGVLASREDADARPVVSSIPPTYRGPDDTEG